MIRDDKKRKLNPINLKNSIPFHPSSLKLREISLRNEKLTEENKV